VGGLPPNNVSKELNMKLKEHRGHILAHLGVNELVKFGYVWIIWMCFLWLDSLAFFCVRCIWNWRSDRGQAGMVHEVRS
jgi:hypothetical protein